MSRIQNSYHDITFFGDIRLLIAPVFLLAIESPLQNLLVDACSFIVDNAQGLTQVIIGIAFTGMVAMMLNWRVVWQMFLPLGQLSPCKDIGNGKEDTSLIPQPRWEWFQTMNWIVSASFLFMLGLVVSRMTSRSNHRDMVAQIDLETMGCFIGCFLCITYLIAFFGVALVQSEFASAHESSESKSMSISLATTVPPIYYAAVTTLVLTVEETRWVRSAVCIIAFFFTLAYAAALFNRHPSGAIVGTSPIPTARLADITASQDGALAQPTLKKCHVVPSYDGTFEDKPVIHDVNNSEDLTPSVYTRMDLPLAQLKFPPLAVTALILTCCAALIYALRTSFSPNARLMICGGVAGLLTCMDVISLLCSLQMIAAKLIWFRDAEIEEPIRAAKRLKTYPKEAANPIGWYRILNSRDLTPGKVIEVNALGARWAVYRGELSGRVFVLDVDCPHMGANLAVGGQVLGDCIQCPFHLWQFDGTGKCVHIPYEKKIPDQAASKRTYYVCEYYGMILLWHNPNVEATSPAYLPPMYPELSEGRFAYRGSFDVVVNMHIQEFAENSTDFQHFDPLHGSMMVPFTSWTIPGLTVNHRPTWKCGSLPSNKHLSWFSDGADLSWRGTPIPESGAQATITFIGPASLVSFKFETKLGNIILFQTHTPVKPLRQFVQFHWYADSSMPRLLVWYVVGNWLAQWRNDLAVWENKIFNSKPCLVKGDGPMMSQRRWYKQFYASSAKDMEW